MEGREEKEEGGRVKKKKKGEWKVRKIEKREMK